MNKWMKMLMVTSCLNVPTDCIDNLIYDWKICGWLGKEFSLQENNGRVKSLKGLCKKCLEQMDYTTWADVLLCESAWIQR